jgi:hypothetical protein
MENNSKSVFDFLDLSEDEAKEVSDKIAQTGNRDGRICICGHAMGYHAFIEGRGVYKCNAQKQTCPCKTPRPVIETTNSRAFMKKTHGSAGLHALTQGIVSVTTTGGSVDWIIEVKCDKCGAEVPVVPCPVTQTGQISNEATGFDKLLCRDCRSGR